MSIVTGFLNVALARVALIGAGYQEHPMRELER
jgi:hypothetical protein